MPSPARAAAAAVATIVACLAAAAPAALGDPYTPVRIAKFSRPDYVASPPAGHRLFVVLRGGRIRVFRHGKLLKKPFLDMSAHVLSTGQRGLLSMAFAPDYARSGRFYVEYVDKHDTVRLDELRRSPSHPDRAVPATRRHVLTVGHGGVYHHGGQLQFGPDGYLWMSTGMDDHPELSQDLSDLHGKLLRIDPRAAAGRPYSVPPDNPFTATAGARPEIWAYGLRNPWRFSFDRLTGDLVLGDVGENTAEEVDYLPHGTGAGANFGFNVFEANQQMIPGPVPARYVPPVIEHVHSHSENGFCAVIGGYVVRDRSLGKLYGRYLYHDLCQQTQRTALIDKAGAHDDRRIHMHRFSLVTSFGEDNEAHLYAVTLSGGVYRLVGNSKTK